MQWFRHYHGLLSDPKFGSIARRTGQPRERVVFVWLSILESASEAKDRGIVATDIDAIADTLNCDDEPIHAIWVEFETRGMLVDGRVAGSPFEFIRSNRPPAHVWRALRSTVFERDDFTCCYCGARGVRLECDHIVPVADGGGHELENLTTACWHCNRSKGAKSLQEWRFS